MSFPSSKIEVYNTADALIHTILDALDIQTNKIISGQAGTFTFTLPAVDSTGANVYDDIGDNYKVKIYLGYGTLAASDLQLAGKIQKHTGAVSTPKGYLRVFEGKDLAEVIERRLKTNKRYIAEAAADVIGDLIADLTAETGITADSENILTPVTITIRTETYLDAIKKVSDYWYSSGGQIKADFHVADATNQLVWKTRPLRTAGVETLTIGENILDYTLYYDILPIKNKITVYGAASAFWPNDKDQETEALTNWIASSGTLSLEASSPAPKMGSNSIKCLFTDSTPPYEQLLNFQLDLPNLNLRDINKLCFWYYPANTGPAYTNLTVRLHAPNSANYFEASLEKLQQWYFANLALGESAEYDADENPTGVWTKTGTPNWWALEAVQFVGGSSGSSGTIFLCVDKLYFAPWRWVYTVEDATSQTAFGIREAEYTDDNLLSNSECEVRAKTLLYQLKDRALRCDLLLKGNTNVKIGDRISITLPAENITALNFDVLSVKHDFSSDIGFQTQASMIYGGEIRKLPPRTPMESAVRQIGALKEVTSELYSRVVR